MPRVLIVDDDRDLAEYVTDELRLAGWETGLAYDGVEAILEILDDDWDVVLMDIRMPRLDGVNALRIVRRLAPDLPVVMFTGQAGQGDIQESYKLGAVDCLPKPVSREKLLATLEKVVSESKLRQAN